MNKKIYYLIGFTVFLGAILGYHFYAASQAEQQINKTIQEQAERELLSAQYSSIDVAPFSATVTIQDLTVIFGDHIERAQHLKLDISYLDFLNIYFGGLSYGLDQLHQANITALQPSYVNKKGLKEIKTDTLHISYNGNALDGIRSAVNGTPFASNQAIEAQGSGIILSFPKTTFSTLEAEGFEYSGTIAKDSLNFWTEGSHQVAMDSLIWTPSESFQSSYSFFIKGFGYPADAIPIQHAQFHSTPASQPEVLNIEASVQSGLALFSSSGMVRLHDPIESSEFQNMNIKITDLSDSFRQVLSNIERLLSVSLPRTNNEIRLQLNGTLSDPRIVQ